MGAIGEGGIDVREGITVISGSAGQHPPRAYCTALTVRRGYSKYLLDTALGTICNPPDRWAHGAVQ